MLSLSEPLKSGDAEEGDFGRGDWMRAETLSDRKIADPSDRLARDDLRRLMSRGLNRAERLIVILYYYEDFTMKEIAATLNLSESRVSQMHSALMIRLREKLVPRRGELFAEAAQT
jgi:RNA polymerase sigma factor for flagellar operon FliA